MTPSLAFSGPRILIFIFAQTMDMEFEIEGLRQGLLQKAEELVRLRKEVRIKESSNCFPYLIIDDFFCCAIGVEACEQPNDSDDADVDGPKFEMVYLQLIRANSN